MNKCKTCNIETEILSNEGNCPICALKSAKTVNINIVQPKPEISELEALKKELEVIKEEKRVLEEKTQESQNQRPKNVVGGSAPLNPPRSTTDQGYTSFKEGLEELHILESLGGESGKAAKSQIDGLFKILVHNTKIGKDNLRMSEYNVENESICTEANRIVRETEKRRRGLT